MRAVRFFLRALVGLVTITVLLLVLVYGLLRTGSVEGTLERIITALAQKEGEFFVRAEGVSGAPPEHLRVRKVEVGDAYGVWLTVENAEATWHPFDLFHAFDVVKWRINVNDIRAERVTWTRLPRDGPDEEDTPFRWDRFIRIIVGHLVIEDFELSGDLLGGQRAHLRVEGSGVLGEWERGFVKLDVRHVDDVEGTARIDLATHGSPLELSGTVEAEEGPGGALAAIARLEDAGAVKLSVRASGPMRSWHAEADLSASNIGVLHAKTDLSYTAEGPFEAGGSFDPVAAQRKRWLVGDGAPIDFAAKGAWAPDVELRLDQVTLVADGRELSAGGRLDLVTDAFRIGGRLGTSPASDAGIVRLTLLDVASARIESTGVLGDGGHLDATLDAERPGVSDASLGALHAVFHARDPVGEGAPVFELAADGKGLSLADQAMPLFGSDVHLTGAGTIDLAKGLLAADKLLLEGGALRVEGPLAFTNEWESMTASLRANASSLASLSDLARMPVAGSATASIDVEAKRAWSDVDVRVNANASDVVLAEQGWNALIGPTVSLSLVVNAAEDAPSRGEFTLQTAGIAATGSGNIAADGTLVADARATLDNLSRLSDPARAAIAGKLDATATARGTREHFNVVATVRGDHVSYDAIRFDTLSADIEAKDLPSNASAVVHSRGRYGKLDAALDGEVSLEGSVQSPDRIVLRGVTLRGPDTTASADLDIQLDQRVASGTVRLQSRDLSLWRPMTGIAIGGAVGLDATLSVSRDAADGPVQQVSGSATVRNGSFPYDGKDVFVDALEASAEGLVLGARPGGAARVHVTRARYETRTLVEGGASAAGDGRVWNIDSRIDVRNGGEVKLAATGTLATEPDVSLVVQTLAGTIDATAVELREPANIRVASADAGTWSVEPLVVAIGTGGLLRAKLSQSPGAMRVEAEASELPLALVSTFVPELDLDGSVDGKVRLEGTSVETASGEIALQGHRVVARGLEAEGVEPVDLQADLRLGGGRLRGSARVEGLTDTRIELKLDAPLAGSASSAPVGVDLVWKGSLAEVAGLLPIGEDTVTGRVDASLRLSGSVAAPRVTGRAVLDGGVWESASTGLVLRDIRAELEGAGTSLQLRSLQATDGEGGTFRADGGVRFEGFPAFDATLNLDATDAVLTRLDLLTTQADAKLVLKASRSAAAQAGVTGAITGNVRVSDGRVEIPQRFVSDVPEIDVIEISEETADIAEVPAGVLAAPRRAALDLDIEVIADNRIFVTGRGLESEWSSNLHVRGTTAEPRIEGTVTSVRGQLSLLGRRFDISSAVLRFDGERDNEPWLTMTARAEANDITAIADVTGPATRPTIELRSEPSLPRDEVLSRLLFGQSAATLSPLQSVQLAQSVAELTGSPLGGGSFISNVGRTLGFDRFGLESAGTSGDAALTASRYLTDDVYLRVQQGLTPESSKLSLEWRVLKHLTIESDISQDAQGEVGATWRWDY